MAWQEWVFKQQDWHMPTSSSSLVPGSRMGSVKSTRNAAIPVEWVTMSIGTINAVLLKDVQINKRVSEFCVVCLFRTQALKFNL